MLNFQIYVTKFIQNNTNNLQTTFLGVQISLSVMQMSLHSTSGIRELMFPRTVLAEKYSLDVGWWFDRSFMNPNAMFEYFGLFSDEDSK